MASHKLIRHTVKIIFLLSCQLFLCAMTMAVPIDRFSSRNEISDVVQSFYQDQFTQELQLVVDDLQSGKRDRAKLRLGKFLSLHKNEPRALHLAGLILLEEGKYADAEESFLRLLKQGVKTDNTYALAGVSAYMQGKQIRAEQYLKAAVFNPEQVLALRYLALIEMERNNMPAAVNYYQKILATPGYKTQKLTKVHIQLADAYVHMGEPDRAISLLDVSPVPTDFQLNRAIVLANAYAIKGNVEQGLSILDGVSIEGTQRFHIDSEKVRFLRQFGDTDRTLKLVDTLLKKYPKARARLYFDKSMILAGIGQFGPAAETMLLSAQLADQVDQALIATKASSFFLQAGDKTQAEKVLRTASANEPDNLTLKYELAELLSKIKGAEDANKLLDEILDKDDTHFKAHYLKGVYAWNAQQVSKALLHFNKAVSINPQFVTGWLALSELEHVRSGDKKMQDTLRAGLKYNPGNPEIIYQLGIQAYTAGDYEQVNALLAKFPENSPLYGDAASLVILSMINQDQSAEEIRKVLSKAKEIAADNVYLLDAEGYFLTRYGKSSEAVKILQSAANAAEDDAAIYLHLSEALLADGQKESAKKAFMKATELGFSSHSENQTAKKMKILLQ